MIIGKLIWDNILKCQGHSKMTVEHAKQPATGLVGGTNGAGVVETILIHAFSHMPTFQCFLLVLTESISYTMSSIPLGPKSSWAISLPAPGCSNTTKKEASISHHLPKVISMYWPIFINISLPTWRRTFIRSQTRMNMDVAIFRGCVYMRTHVDKQTCI